MNEEQIGLLHDRWFGCYDTPRGGLFTRESNRHPAKMAVGLCFRILEHGERAGYWKPGDTILDPMCGIGTTLICAGMKGYNALGVELEEHFYKLALANIEHARWKFPLPAVGQSHSTRTIRGDARNLPALLGSAPTCRGGVTSPPYGGKNENPSGPDPHPERTHGYAHGGSFANYDAALSSPPYADPDLTGKNQFRSRFQPDRPTAAENPHEGYAAAVSSPPYTCSTSGGGIAEKGHYDDAKLGERCYQGSTIGEAPAQIGNLRDPSGDIDAVLSSRTCTAPLPGAPLAAVGIDAALTSPPFEDVMPMRPGFETSGMRVSRPENLHSPDGQYGEAPGQIGRERGETYCTAMLQVYRGMWTVLRPSAVVALVTKNPVKDRALRRLDLDTIRLMDSVGFALLERKYAMLAEEKFPLFPGLAKRERKSFFKRLYEKNGGIRVDHEDVLFFRRVLE
jgi:hypothetical protein